MTRLILLAVCLGVVGCDGKQIEVTTGSLPVTIETRGACLSGSDCDKAERQAEIKELIREVLREKNNETICTR